jgi:hypothetical protein
MLGKPCARLAEQSQLFVTRRCVREHGLDDGLGVLIVLRGRVVERAVRLDVRDAGAGNGCQPVKGSELVDNVIDQACLWHLDEPPAESTQVGETHLGSDPDTVRSGDLAGTAQDVGITGVEPTGHVGVGDERQQCLVVSHRPLAVSLTDVGVQRHDRRASLCLRLCL